MPRSADGTAFTDPLLCCITSHQCYRHHHLREHLRNSTLGKNLAFKWWQISCVAGRCYFCKTAAAKDYSVLIFWQRLCITSSPHVVVFSAGWKEIFTSRKDVQLFKGILLLGVAFLCQAFLLQWHPGSLRWGGLFPEFILKEKLKEDVPIVRVETSGKIHSVTISALDAASGGKWQLLYFFFILDFGCLGLLICQQRRGNPCGFGGCYAIQQALLFKKDVHKPGSFGVFHVEIRAGWLKSKLLYQTFLCVRNWLNADQ